MPIGVHYWHVKARDAAGNWSTGINECTGKNVSHQNDNVLNNQNRNVLILEMLYWLFFEGGQMAEKDIIMLSRREVNRLHIVKKAIEKEIKQGKQRRFF